MKSRLLPLLLSLLLAACAAPAPEAPTSTVKLVTTVGGMDDLLAYHQSLRRLSPQELGRELQALNARHGGGAMLAMQKAMVLGLTHDAGDLTKAQAQLGSVVSATDSDAAALKPLAQLLVSNYAEMRRLNDNADKASQQARDNQRRLDQLSEKLEALKNIERTLPGQPK